MRDEKILQVKKLSVHLKEKQGTEVQIIKDISFELYKGECIGILGESGSGKSMTMKAILGLLEKNFVITGSALYEEKDLLKESTESLRRCRGKEITTILQNPMTCFDPLYRMEEQISETWLAHSKMTQTEIHEEAVKMLEQMHIFNAEEVLRKYPHQLSGGMLQRITIGLALSMKPKILIADEPTTAIDAITQFEMMKEFQKIRDSRKTGMVFITHDLGVISKIADRILVMSQGKIVDRGDFKHIVEAAEDPYTKQLVQSKMMVMKQYHQALQKGSRA